jgi:hypothetical protein
MATGAHSTVRTAKLHLLVASAPVALQVYHVECQVSTHYPGVPADARLTDRLTRTAQVPEHAGDQHAGARRGMEAHREGGAQQRRHILHAALARRPRVSRRRASHACMV